MLCGTSKQIDERAKCVLNLKILSMIEHDDVLPCTVVQPIWQCVTFSPVEVHPTEYNLNLSNTSFCHHSSIKEP